MIDSEKYQKKLAVSIKNILSNYFISKSPESKTTRTQDKNNSFGNGTMILLTEFFCSKKENSFKVAETIFGPDLNCSEDQQSFFSNSNVEITLNSDSYKYTTFPKRVVKGSIKIKTRSKSKILSKSLSSSKIASNKNVSVSPKSLDRKITEDLSDRKTFPKEKHYRSIRRKLRLNQSTQNASREDGENCTCGELMNYKIPFITEVILKAGQEYQIEKLVKEGEKYKVVAPSTPAFNNSCSQDSSNGEESFKLYKEKARKLPALSAKIKEKVEFFERKASELKNFKRQEQKKFVVNLYESLTPEVKDNLVYITAMDSDHLSSEEDQCKLSSATETDLEELELPLQEDYDVSPPTYSEPETNSDYASLGDEKEEALLQEYYKQQSILEQVEKVIDVCKNSNTFVDNEIIATANKISLITDLKRKILLNEWQKLTEDYTEIESISSARVTISDLAFDLKPLITTKIKCNTIFLITCTSDSLLYSSNLLRIDSDQKLLELSEPLVFDVMPPDFIIDLNIYQLQIPIPQSKRNLHNFKKSIYRAVCISKKPTKIATSSAFMHCGNLRLVYENLSDEIFLLDKLVPRSMLTGMAKLKSSITNLVVNKDHSGFITVGTEIMGRIIWDRKWCRLENTILNFWDNPNEELFNTPKIAINLEHCSNDKVEIAGKDLCARSRTLILVGINFNASDISSLSGIEIQYFLTADSVEEMQIWQCRINSVLRAVKLWETR